MARRHAGWINGWVARNEQCVCHRGGKSRDSWRTTYGHGCRAESHEIPKETIVKRRARVLDRDALAAEVADLSKAGITDLRERWKTLYGKEASGHIGPSLMIRGIPYLLQERTLVGLKPSAQRILE